MSKKDESSSDSSENIIDFDSSTEFVVEKILDRRTYRGHLQYLVKWKNCTEEDNTWEMAASLVELIQGCDLLIKSYEKLQTPSSRRELNIIYENKAKRLKIDPSIVLESPFSRDFKAEEILKGYKNNGEVSFLIKFWHLKQPQVVPSCIAYVEIPQMVLRFYEKHSDFPSSQAAFSDQQWNSYFS
ncbi:heterochromatin protein 1 isoform X2 [Drosophila kikkawai]|uniref:Heterochromatin protein 1 isoform X2 n=1 Tax=Drosophila kikkawai TaxID=30033 RepID=A0ABM4GJL6_DROKI